MDYENKIKNFVQRHKERFDICNITTKHLLDEYTRCIESLKSRTDSLYVPSFDTHYQLVEAIISHYYIEYIKDGFSAHDYYYVINNEVLKYLFNKYNIKYTNSNQQNILLVDIPDHSGRQVFFSKASYKYRIKGTKQWYSASSVEHFINSLVGAII